jgi:hypothetical protein
MVRGRECRRPGGRVEAATVVAALVGGGGRVGRRRGAGLRHRGHGQRDVHLAARLQGDPVGSARLRRRRRCRCDRRRDSAGALVAVDAGRGPTVRRERRVRRAQGCSRRVPAAFRRARADQSEARRVPRSRSPARGVTARADLLGLARPAKSAGRHACDDRGPRGRDGRGPGALPPPDPVRGGPDGADGRRPLRAVPDPRGQPQADPGTADARRHRQRGDRQRGPGRPGARRPARGGGGGRSRAWSRTC